ncbi:Aminotransferase-like mobile domain containing protein [Trema orientale]|uniref:Aminotransferase-like mobile domain containing protein n=1 Tax=Trema orientale TaxID=63057 RepID=A0A2P5ERV6_TREOI|nr:Aminotransferase-like mobile domain containing protein [Trema orientale]
MREEVDHFFDTGLAQSFRTDQGETKRGDFLYDHSDNPFGPTPGSILHFRHAIGDLPISDVVFLTKTHSMQGWRQWVLRVASRHSEILKSLEVFEAIWVSLRLRIDIDREGLKSLLCRWCPETHTFVCSWGEFTVTLEDVCALYQLPLCGSHDLLSQTPSPEEQGLVDELERIHQRLGKVVFAKWAHYFFYHYKGESTVSTLELAGFLACWLCRHVFYFSPINVIHRRVFPLACMMACGKKFALGPLYLGTLYRRMDQFVSDMIRSVGRYQVRSYVDSLFLQAFLWARLDSCRTGLKKSISILRASEQERRLFGSLAPYLWRWENCCCKRIQANMLDNCREFLFRPDIYGYPVFDIYNSKGPKLDAEEDQNLTDSADIASSPVIYSPHRVMRQFGYHRHAPCFEKIKTVEQASQALVITSLSQLRSTLENIRAPFPAYWSESDASNKVSSRFYAFWKDLTREFHEFEKGSSDASFAIGRAVSIVDFTLRLPQRKMILPGGFFRKFLMIFALLQSCLGIAQPSKIPMRRLKFGTDQEREKQAIDNRDEVNGDNSSPIFKSKESSSSAIPKGNGVDLSAADDPVTNISIDPSASNPAVAAVFPAANASLTKDHDSTTVFPLVLVSSSSSSPSPSSSTSSFSSSSTEDFDPQALPSSFLMPNMTRDNDDSTMKLVEAAATPNLTDCIGNSEPPDSSKISFHDIVSDNSAAHTPAISHSNVPNSSLRTPRTVENIMSPNKSRPGISLQEPEHSDEQLASTNRRNSITEEELLPYFKLYESQDPSLTPQLESLRPFHRANVIWAIGEIIIVFADTPVEEVSCFHRDLVEERWEELCLWGLKLPIMKELIDTARKPTRFDEVCDKISNAEQSWKVFEEEMKTAKLRFEELEKKTLRPARL